MIYVVTVQVQIEAIVQDAAAQGYISTIDALNISLENQVFLLPNNKWMSVATLGSIVIVFILLLSSYELLAKCQVMI